jgi:hypothetical protein
MGAGMTVDQVDQIDGRDAQNRTGKVVEAGDQRCEVTAQ